MFAMFFHIYYIIQNVTNEILLFSLHSLGATRIQINSFKSGSVWEKKSKWILIWPNAEDPKSCVIQSKTTCWLSTNLHICIWFHSTPSQEGWWGVFSSSFPFHCPHSEIQECAWWILKIIRAEEARESGTKEECKNPLRQPNRQSGL